MRRILWLACALVLISACGGQNAVTSGEESPFETFKSKAEFDAYLLQIEKKKQAPSGQGEESPSADLSEGETAQTQNGLPQIETNNQSANVDEGDIIKFAGEYMVVLRDKHLLVLNVSGNYTARPTVISDKELDADFGAGAWGKGAWYDEMLVFDSKIILIAYRYNVNLEGNDPTDYYYNYTGAIEILKFGLSTDGKLDNGERLFLESNDYYSGATNYTSRKIGNRLVIYSPFSTTKYSDGSSAGYAVPYVLELKNASKKLFARSRPSVLYSDIYKGSQEFSGQILHTVYSFDVNKPLDSYNTGSVLGNHSNTYYVTDEHFYISLPEQWKYTGLGGGVEVSQLYQFDLTGSIVLKNMTGLNGSVPERFAFDEEDNSIRIIAQDKCEYGGRQISQRINAVQFDADTFELEASSEAMINGCYLSSVRFNGDRAVLSYYSNAGSSKDTSLLLASFTKSSVSLSENGLGLSNILMMQPLENDKWIAIAYQINSDETSYSYYYDFSLNMLQATTDTQLVRVSSLAFGGEDSAWSESFWNDHTFFIDIARDLFAIPYTIIDDVTWKAEEGVQYFSISGNLSIDKLSSIIQTGDSCEECWYGNSRVVRRGSYYYNLVGRQLKVAVFDNENVVMREVSSLELFDNK